MLYVVGILVCLLQSVQYSTYFEDLRIPVVSSRMRILNWKRASVQLSANVHHALLSVLVSRQLLEEQYFYPPRGFDDQPCLHACLCGLVFVFSGYNVGYILQKGQLGGNLNWWKVSTNFCKDYIDKCIFCIWHGWHCVSSLHWPFYLV